MKIEIVIIAEANTQVGQPPTHALALQLRTEGTASMQPDPIILQRGYVSPNHALAALLECLTFSPPDLSTYDEGLANLSGLLDRTRDLEEAMTSVGGRLNDVEEKVDALLPAVPAANRLLPPRVAPPGQPTAPAHPPNANPSIRQPRRNVVSAGHGAGGAVRGGAAMLITGGVGRPGDLGPTGAGADDEGVDTGD